MNPFRCAGINAARTPCPKAPKYRITIDISRPHRVRYACGIHMPQMVKRVTRMDLTACVQAVKKEPT